MSPHEDPFLEGLCLALFQVLLYRYSGEADIIIGTAVSGRAQSEVQQTLGPFENHLPIRLANDDALTFDKLCASRSSHTNTDTPATSTTAPGRLHACTRDTNTHTLSL